MYARMKNLSRLLVGNTRLLMFCGSLMFCGACGVNEPDPQPEPFPDPVPDPVNTNGMDPDPVDPDPINPDPIDTNGVDPVPEPGPADLIGIWHVVEEYGFSNHLDYESTYVRFEDGGIAMFFGKDDSTKIKECRDVAYRLLGETGITIESEEDGLEALVYQFSGFDTLLLTDHSGIQLTLRREEFVPAEYNCRTMHEVHRFETERTWKGKGELETDGEAFWFNVDTPDEIAMVSTLGVTGEPVPAPSQFPYILAMQQGDFWSHKSSGSDEIVQRSTRSGIAVDTVDTHLDLGFEINLEYAAIDFVTDDLLLFGRSDVTKNHTFLRVDTSNEPDVLIEAVEFDVFLDSVTHDGEFIWALYYGYVFKINPRTYEAIETYRVQLADGYASSIASYKGRLFVLFSSNEVETASIVELQEGGPIVPTGYNPNPTDQL